MTGRTGCGLCGTENLESAIRPAPSLPVTQTFDLCHYEQGLGYLEDVEALGELTGCTHAAVWVNPDGTLAGGVEDVGRHVALDKLLGLRALNGWKEGALFPCQPRRRSPWILPNARASRSRPFAVPDAGRSTPIPNDSCEAKRRAEVSTSRKKQKSGGRRQLFPPVACRRKEKFPRMESIFLSKSIGNKDFSFFREQIRR